MKNVSIAKSIIFLVTSLAFGWGIAQFQQDDEKKTPVIPKDNLPEIKLNQEAPLGLMELPSVPENNPLSDVRVALGRKLFFDPILSENGTVSCASCHQPDHGFASPDPKAIGLAGRTGKRNAPSLFNKGFATHLFWDGRAETLEEQALKPLSNRDELASDIELVLAKLRSNEEYIALFANVFDTNNDKAITPEHIGKAIASFERTLVMGNTQVDRFHAAEYDALTESARQGMWIFESRGKCWKCHNGTTFSDQEFHNTGVSFGEDSRDAGRFEHSKTEVDKFKFKTPSLRGVEKTAPYMHDGSVKTLREVVEFYNKGGSPEDPTLSKDIEPLNLSDEEVDNLVDFLKALSN